jgi:hypothetical protein
MDIRVLLLLDNQKIDTSPSMATEKVTVELGNPQNALRAVARF